MTREQLKHCGTIIKDLKKHRDAGPFLVPVDYVALQIPDYPAVVRFPMDLSTVERKLNSVEYETVDDFVTDINLIFSNCYLYNGVEAPVSKSAKNLQTAFERLLRRMPGEVSSMIGVSSIACSSIGFTGAHTPDVRISRALNLLQR